MTIFARPCFDASDGAVRGFSLSQGGADKKSGRDEQELLACSRGYAIWGYGLYHSLLSAFHPGWR